MKVSAVHRSDRHAFSKDTVPRVRLVEGHGVADDAHFGVTVQHRSRVAKNPHQPNLRQVHLLHEELLVELQRQGFAVRPGELGENITTRGIDLLALAAGTALRIGQEAIVEITGLRNPCAQIDAFRPGLLAAVVSRAADGTLLRKAGVMAVVSRGGIVAAGDGIAIERVPERHSPLHPV